MWNVTDQLRISDLHFEYLVHVEWLRVTLTLVGLSPLWGSFVLCLVLGDHVMDESCVYVSTKPQHTLISYGQGEQQMDAPTSL